MKHLGYLLLFLAAAATGLATYLLGDGMAGFKSPVSRLFLILSVIVFSNIVTAIGVWLLKKYVGTKDKSELKQVTSVFRYVVLILLVFVIAFILYGIIGPLITSIGLLAAGLTLALQRPILNLGGWLLIVTKRPFRIGDRVDIGPIRGFVHEISLMHTHLSLVEMEEPTGKVVYVPNEQALTQPIINYTRGSALVWDSITVKAPIRVNVREISEILEACAEEVIGKEMHEAANHWGVELKPEVRVALAYNALQPYVEITVRYLCNAKSITIIKTDMAKKVLERCRGQFGEWSK